MDLHVTYRHAFGDIVSPAHQLDVTFPTISAGSDPNYCMDGNGSVWMANGEKVLSYTVHFSVSVCFV
jgi:hypothetical protein